MTDLPAFWERMRVAAPELPTTSQPSIGDFLGCYEPLLQAGHDIVSIHLSAGISGTYDSALQARAQLAERGLDEAASRCSTRARSAAASGSQLLAAAACGRAGGEPAGRRPRRAPRARACGSGSSSTRWSTCAAAARRRRAGLDRRRAEDQADPLAGVQIEPVERVRTAGRAFERMVEYMRTLHADGADAWCVQHIQAPARRSGSSSAAARSSAASRASSARSAR